MKVEDCSSEVFPRIKRRTQKVRVDLMGGIGNQLFIYFAGHFLAKKCKAELVLLTNLLESTNQSHPGQNIKRLGLFGTFTSNPSPFYTFKRRALNYVKRRSRLIDQVVSKISPYYFSDRVGFDENLANLTPPCHIHGYFQTWKYAEDSMPEFKNVLDNYEAISIRGSDLIAESISKLPIAIHIRLGDYRNEINKNFGMMSQEYYKEAVKFVFDSQEFSDHEVWVYSDDITEAKKIYSQALPPIAKWVDEANQINDMDIFVALRNASAHIIGNSSFSWWAAFSSSTSRMKVAPTKWFMNMRDPDDLLPLDWKRVESDWRLTDE